MFSKLNLLLLIVVTLSAFYVTDLRLSIKHQTQLYGKGQEEEIRLKQDRADLLYEHSRHSDARFVSETAQKMNLREAGQEEIQIVKF